VTIEEVEKDGRIHPCNGYILVVPHEEHTDLIVVRDGDSYECAVVVETSDDETEEFEVKAEQFEWRKGDLVYFKDSIQVDGNTFIHWMDIVAYKRFL